MSSKEIESLERALASREWVELKAPNGTMGFSEEYLRQMQPAELRG